MWRRTTSRSVCSCLRRAGVLSNVMATSPARASSTTASNHHHSGSSSSGGYGANHPRGAADYYNQTKEDEEDKVLEDEEFAALRSEDGDEFMPIAHRLAHKADALDADLRRLRYMLCDQPQFLVDTAAATVSGRPTNMPRVLELLQKDALASSHSGEKRDTSRAAGASRAGKSWPGLSSVLETSLRASPYAAWTGTSAPVTRLLSRHVLWRSAALSSSAGADQHNTALATLDANLDYLRRLRGLHQLNYYSRLNLTPKRHLGMAVYQVLWNFVIAAQNACGCVVYGVMRGMKEHGVAKGVVTGSATGTVKACEYLAYGFVLSPLLHLSRGLCNSVYGPLNALTGKYMFDAISGRWMRCTVADTYLFRHELQREKRVLRTIGRAEFRRKKMQAENKWATRLASMGFSVDMLADKFKPGGSSSSSGTTKAEDKVKNPYEVLQVRRTASAQEVKKQYKKLAMVFHPDVAQSRNGGAMSAEEKASTQRKFEDISNAYQILSNPEKRKAYDMGGAQGVHLHETKYGKFMSRTPEEMVQNIFGGEGFRRMLVGEILRSHWSLRYEAQVSVSLHELEELQCIRVRQIAMELATIADVHALRPTTPYHGGHASSPASSAAAGGGAQASQRRGTSAHGGLSSSLPDYMKSGKPKSRLGSVGVGRAAGTARASHSSSGVAGGTGGIGQEMHNTIMEELGGGGHAKSTTAGAFSSSSSRLGAKKHDASSTEAAAAADGMAALSPYVLHPGSNEFNCFSRDFEERCDKLVRRLADACFGKQLLYEVGEAYVTNAQRFLGIRPFYASKTLVTRKIFSGMDRVADAFRDKTRLDKEKVGQKMMAEYLNMEYDSVVADIHVALRYALQMVLQDAVVSDEVRRKRCYAVWLLGEKMMTVGEKWTSRIASDEDLVAYVQQAATSMATTSKPPAF